MTTLDPVFEDIDSYLHRLNSNVGDVNYFREWLAPGFRKDIPKYLAPYTSWSERVHSNWDKWKISHAEKADMIREYDVKLKQCDAYLTLMKSVLSEGSHTPTKVETSQDADQIKSQQITALLKPEVISAFKQRIPEENIDQAFRIVKSMTYAAASQTKLYEILEIHLAQNSVKGCKKAYEIARYTQQQGRDDSWLLDKIVEKCMSLRTPGSESFLSDILKFYPKCDATIVREADPILPDLFAKPDIRNSVLDALVEKGDKTAINEREAEDLADKGQFKEAVTSAQSLSDPIIRKGVMGRIHQKCCEAGSKDSLRFAIEIALQHDDPQFRMSYLNDVIEACKKHKDREIAFEAANRIEDTKFRAKIIEKLNRPHVFR